MYARFLDTLFRLAILTLIGLLPLFLIPLSWITFSQSKSILILILGLIATCAWIGARIIDRTLTIPSGYILPASIGIALAYLISSIVHGWKTISVWGSGAGEITPVTLLLLSTLLFLASVGFGRKTRHTTYALRIVLISSIVPSGIGILHFLNPSFMAAALSADPGATLLGTMHDLAVFDGLILLIALCSTRTAAGRGALWLTVSIIAGLAACTTLLIAGTSGVLILIACISIALATWRALLNTREKRLLRALRKEATLWTGGIVFLLLGIWGTAVLQAIPGYPITNTLEAPIPFSYTKELLAHSFTSAQHIAFGTGPNTFARAWDLYKPTSILETPFWNVTFTQSSNFAATTLITVGILGTLAWALFIAVLMWTSQHLLRKEVREDQRNADIAVLVAGTLYLSTLCLFSTPHFTLFVITFLLIGLMLASADAREYLQHYTIRLNYRPLKNPVTWITFFVSIIVLVSFAGAARVLASDTLTNRAIAVHRLGDTTKATSLLSEALALYPKNADAYLIRSQITVEHIRTLAKEHTGSNEEYNATLKQLVDQSVSDAIRAVTIDGGSSAQWMTLGALYGQLAEGGVSGAYEQAEDAYHRGLALAPYNPTPYLDLARLAVQKGDTDAAMQNLESALRIKSDLSDAYYLGSRILAQKGEMADALAAAKNAAGYAKGSPLAWYNIAAISFAVKDYSTAAAAAQQALQIRPEYADASFLLGMSYLRLGNREEARTILTSLNENNPGQKAIQAALKELDIPSHTP